MMLTRLPLIAILSAGALAAHAQDGPAFDCAKAESSAETLICQDAALAALDRRLASRFAAAVEVAKGLDVGARETENTLRAMQRGWISGRDDCWKADDLRTCVETEYLQREAELTAEFLLEQPSQVQELFCGDGNRSFTLFEFATELPGLRVEEGDSIYVGRSCRPTLRGSTMPAAGAAFHSPLAICSSRTPMVSGQTAKPQVERRAHRESQSRIERQPGSADWHDWRTGTSLRAQFTRLPHLNPPKDRQSSGKY